MSKECQDCQYFNGWCYDDGTPICDYDGKEMCPYHSQTTTTNKGISIEIDSGFMSEYIKHTIKNTVENVAGTIAIDYIQSIIDNNIKDQINTRVKEELDKKIQKTIDAALEDFMNETINIGGWYGEKKQMTRRQYVTEQIQKNLSGVNADSIKKTAKDIAQKSIDTFTSNLRADINKNIKTCFDEVTRQTLTDNVVSMLMNNDTYKRLSDSMSHLLPNGSIK